MRSVGSAYNDFDVIYSLNPILGKEKSYLYYNLFFDSNQAAKQKENSPTR